MKLDIENKILIPFMILIILSIMSLGAVSYWNGYRLLVDSQKKNIEENIKETIYFLDNINAEIVQDKGTLKEAKKKVLAYYEKLHPAGLVIMEKNRFLINNFAAPQFLQKNIIKKTVQQPNGVIAENGMFFLYKTYEKWGWVIGYGLNKSIFSEELVEIQKYTLLVAIIFLVVSMQATIFIAHNLSRPIKLLADVCNKIAKGNLKEKIHIRRKDEIGILANAFNNMMDEVEMKQFNEDILRNISSGIITTDKIGNVISMNPTAEKILKWNIKDQENSQTIGEVLLNQLKDTLQTKRNINKIHLFWGAADRNKIYLDVTTSLLKTEDYQVSGAICNFLDITERKKIENKIERVNRLTSVGQLAAGLAHEIRNPLAGMKMSIQVLKKRLCTTEAEPNCNLFNGVLYEIDRLNSLITDLLDFAKPRRPQYEKTNIMTILNKSLYLIKKTASEKKIKINVIVRTKKLWVFVDKAQIEQVFLNILANGIKAMALHGIFNIRLEYIPDEKGKFLIIEFHDNGCGIPQGDMEKIFNPFFTTHPQGTGLGLSVVHKLVTENNGEIEVESKVGEGTKFKIKFPVYGGEESETAHTHY